MTKKISTPLSDDLGLPKPLSGKEAAQEVLSEYDQYVDENISEEWKEEAKKRALRFAVDTNALTDEVKCQPADYAYIAHTLVVHQALAAKARLQMEVIAAKIKTAIKDGDPRSAKSGGPTLDQIDAMVKQNPQYLEALVTLRNAEDRVAHSTADATASAQKAAMLRLLSGLVQTETQMRGYQSHGKQTYEKTD